MTDPRHLPEADRQRALDRYRILDTLPDGAYDDIVRVAAAVCDAPVAVVSLIDRDRQWLKARVGIQARETARDVAFCDHAIRTPDRLTEVHDLREDPRFSANPYVAGDMGARFYAGMPLVTPEGAALGTVCVIDHAPRTLTGAQRDALEALSRLTMALMDAGQREHDNAAAAVLSAPAPAAVAREDFTVAILELQDHAGLVERQGDRATQRTLDALDQAFDACLGQAGPHHLGRVTGSAEFIAILRGTEAQAESALQCLHAEIGRQRATGLDLRVGTARSNDPGEALPLVYLRADEALSAEKGVRGG